MKILAFSDLHLDIAAADRILAMHADADLVLGAGDFATRHHGLAEYMARLEPLAHKAVFVAGNNESIDALRDATSAVVLHGEQVEYRGVVIAGLGGGIPPNATAPFESWDLMEEEAAQMLSDIDRCDIFLTHSPPKGVADNFASMRSIGSKSLRAVVERLQPTLMLFGHVHDDWGQEGEIGHTRCRNLGPAGWCLEL